MTDDTYLPVGTRVEIHPASDAWMQGDRYGVVVGIGRHGGLRRVRLDKSGREPLLVAGGLTEIPTGGTL